MKTLKLYKEGTLPLDATTQKLAWLGTTGSGKTYGASKFAEQLWKEDAQFVVLDPVGVWYGLRLAKDGKKPSNIDIPIFGGLHGDVPLDPAAGKLIANLIVEKTLSAIIDVSQFESDAAKARFSADFADQFFFLKKSKPSAVHLFIEECQEFVPQNIQRGEERMLHAFVRMQKLGRNFGIGSSYISQRPQEVNKKALNMAQTLFVFRNTGTHERKAIELWIKDNSLDENIANDLPKIPTGQCHVWSPEFLKISEMVHILEKETFNASATPEVGKKAKAASLSSIDVKALKESMAEVVKQAELEDPKALRKRISELEAAAKHAKPGNGPMGVSQWLNHGEKYKYTDFFDKKYQMKIGELQNVILKFEKAFEGIEKILHPLLKTERIEIKSFDLPKDFGKIINISPQIGNNGLIPDQTVQISSNVDGKPLGKGEIAMLTAIAQQDGITREHLTVVTGYKKSSRDTYIQRLQQPGYIRAALGRLHITSEGKQILGSDYKPLPTGADLRDHLMATLPAGERKILGVLISSYPEAVTREYLTETTEYQKSSRDTYIQRLSSRELVVTDRGTVKASDNLFE